ncbi:uncharacterized protein LOC126340003 [Schistocerca gregaria]|uniref:uncharacterized protein LOC126340003 n=1 Tax=Schistocerca gregaria TaxID=7010 RepID=UPI00211EAD24|nr:uncharacterized protein LOC126340003 [Schistocerca gregaria]
MPPVFLQKKIRFSIERATTTRCGASLKRPTSCLTEHGEYRAGSHSAIVADRDQVVWCVKQGSRTRYNGDLHQCSLSGVVVSGRVYGRVKRERQGSQPESSYCQNKNCYFCL